MVKENIEQSEEKEGDSGVKLAMIKSHISEEQAKLETIEQPKAAVKPAAKPVAPAAEAAPEKKKTSLVQSKNKSKSATQKMIDTLQSLIDGDADSSDLLSQAAGLTESSFVQLKLDEQQKASQAAREKT